MGNIRPSFIKIRAIRLVEEHGEKFTDDFDHNKKMVEEREAARKSLDEINEKLKDVNLDKKDKADLEEEARRLETVINMFDAGG